MSNYYVESVDDFDLNSSQFEKGQQTTII